MATKKLTREFINKRIKNLFGDIGDNEGQYYFDNYYCSVVQVINESGGVRRILNANSPLRLLEILDGIETYLYYKENNKRKELNK